MSDLNYQKPIPEPTPETRVFWEKTREHQLWIQRCVPCSRPFFYPRFHCPVCLSEEVKWFHASGQGTLYSYLINHRPPPGFEDDGPYAIAIVQLQEGPRMMSNIVEVANTPENLKIDMPLEVVFEDITPDITIPKWRPV